jgi:hypothetical protein
MISARFLDLLEKMLLRLTQFIGTGGAGDGDSLAQVLILIVTVIKNFPECKLYEQVLNNMTHQRHCLTMELYSIG